MNLRVLARRLAARLEHELAERDFWNAALLNAERLRRQGARIGPGVFIAGLPALDGPARLLEFGPSSALGEDSLLMTRDLTALPFLGLRREAPVRFEELCEVPRGCLVAAGVTIGARAVAVAGAVVTRDLPPDSGAMGNPALPRPVARRWYLARLHDLRTRPEVYRERAAFTVPTPPWPDLPREGIHVERDPQGQPEMSGVRRRARRLLERFAELLQERDERVLSEERIRRLRKMGVAVGEHCFVDAGAWIDPRPGLVQIGSHCVIGREATILAHDGILQFYVGWVRVEPVRILDGCVLEPRSMVMPGVTIGPGSIVRAGAVVTKDVPPYTVVEGSPARVVMSTHEWLRRMEAERQAHPERFIPDDRCGRFPLPPQEPPLPAASASPPAENHAEPGAAG